MFHFSSIVGLDLHDHLIQFVEIKKWGKKASLEAYNRLTLTAGLIEDGEVKNPDEVKRKLNELFQTAHPKAVSSNRIAFILPTKITFIHFFRFPAHLVEKDLKKILPIEVENTIPYSIDELYWDFKVLERGDKKDKSTHQTVLFAGSPKKVVDMYVQLFSDLGFVSVLFGIQPEALRFALSDTILDDHDSMVIELGALSCNFLFLRGKAVSKFISINGGIESLIQNLAQKHQLIPEELWANWEKMKTEERFHGDIQNFVQEQYQQSQEVLDETMQAQAKNISLIFLTGEFSNLPGFYESAERFFKGRQVMIGDPKSNLKIDDTRFISSLEKKGGRIPYSIYFTNAIGLCLRALASAKSGVNLIPDELKQHLSEKKKMILISGSAVFFTLASGLLSSYLFYLQQQYIFQRTLLEIDRSGIEKTLYGTRYQEIKEALTTFNTEVSALSKIDKSLISVPIVMQEMISIFPPGIAITTLSFEDKDLTIDIAGIAQNRSNLITLQESLSASPYVEKVEVPLSAYDVRSDTSFSVHVILDFSELPFYASSSSEQ